MQAPHSLSLRAPHGRSNLLTSALRLPRRAKALLAMTDYHANPAFLVIASPEGAKQSPDISAEIAASGKSPPRNDRFTVIINSSYVLKYILET
ncbi:MAG: hypothetical protein GYA26_01190 [Flexilinea flocculi]|nr:hypothetical protein [Flexilinea flocculi]